LISIQDEFKRLHIDKQLVVYHIIEGSLHEPEVYFKAVKEVCKVALSMQPEHDFLLPIAIFKGNIRFIDDNIPKLIRVSTSLNIYDRFWDVFKLSCEDATFNKELLRGDIFRGNSSGDFALLLSPTTFHKLANTNTTSNQPEYTTLKSFMDKECKQQLLLAHPICFQSDYLNLDKLIVQADLSLTVWYAVGKYYPNFFQTYVYNHIKLSHNI
jgi:hypothetical protein